jgi:hypothetical protein
MYDVYEIIHTFTAGHSTQTNQYKKDRSADDSRQGVPEKTKNEAFLGGVDKPRQHGVIL